MRFLVGLFLAALAVVGFASTFVVGAELTKTCGVSPEVLAFLRFAIAGGAMLTVVRRAPHTRTDWLAIAWLGPVGTSLMAWCVFMGCARVSAANASMADALTPLMIFAVAAARARQIARLELIALLFGFVGALLVIRVLDGDGLHLAAYSLGDVYVLLAAATWGFYTVYGREPIKRLGSSVFTTWTMLVGAAAIGVFLPFGDFVWPSGMKAWMLIVVLGFVSTLMPFWAWNAAQKFLPMSVLGISAYFTPAFAVLLAIVFLNEPATCLQWLGTVLIIFSAAVERQRLRI